MRRPLDKLRRICLALPEAHEVEAWGEPTFRVKNKLFAMYAAHSNHHGSGRSGVWIKSTHVNQDLLLNTDADRFFKPPYVGPSGWIGVYLDNDPDWDVVGELLRDGYVLTAPRQLAALLDGEEAGAKAAPERPTGRARKGSTGRKRAAKSRKTPAKAPRKRR